MHDDNQLWLPCGCLDRENRFAPTLQEFEAMSKRFVALGCRTAAT